VADICERIRQEFVMLEGSALTWKMDLEKVTNESIDYQRALKQVDRPLNLFFFFSPKKPLPLMER